MQDLLQNFHRIPLFLLSSCIVCGANFHTRDKFEAWCHGEEGNVHALGDAGRAIVPVCVSVWDVVCRALSHGGAVCFLTCLSVELHSAACLVWSHLQSEGQRVASMKRA
jgi:hypothetical protein